MDRHLPAGPERHVPDPDAVVFEDEVGADAAVERIRLKLPPDPVRPTLETAGMQTTYTTASRHRFIARR